MHRFLTGQRPCASSGYRKQALLLLVSGRNGGAQWPGVSQHCRQGLKACCSSPPSPALLHLPEPRDGTGAGPGSPLQHSRTCKRFHWPPSWQQSSRGAGHWGFPKPPVSKAPTTGTTQQGPKGSAGFSGDTGETQRTLESSFCPDSGITAS